MPAWQSGALAAAGGMLGWLAWLQLLPSAPVELRAVVALLVFVLGPGVAVAGPLTRHADRLEAAIVPLGAGLVTAATAAFVLGWSGASTFFPWLSAALTGLGVRSRLRHGGGVACPDRRAIVAGLLVAALAAGVGAFAYAKRLSFDGENVVVNGSYDSYDSSYYAAMSAELATHVPPHAPFQAGHWLNYSFYPQLVLAMVFRFGGVPLLDLYFRLAWPVFLTMMALTAFIFVRRIATTAIAALAVCLLLLGSDFSYLAAVFFRGRPNWDDLLWSTNWMTPSAEMLFFNPWTPALCVLFLGLWALVHAGERDERAGIVASSVCFGSLVQFKPFAFASVVAALGALLLLARLGARDRRRVTIVLAVSIAVGTPYLISIAAHYQDSQSVLALGNGYVDVLPAIVMRQLGFGTVLAPIASALGAEWNRWPATLLPMVAANILFVVGGIGVRLIGAPAVWRALWPGEESQPVWSMMAWMIVVGVVSPFFLISQPYHQTFQFLQLSLFLLWIFAARAVFLVTDGHAWQRAAVVAAVVMAALPSTVHYLQVKWHDDRQPFAIVDPDLMTVIDYLKRQDPDRTVLLQHYPDRPCLACTLSERRTVLAWARYARDSAPLRAEIDAFFTSHGAGPEQAWAILTRHEVTHVLEAVGNDRIHPDVLQSLQVVVVTPTLRLYAVPARPHRTARHRSP